MSANTETLETIKTQTLALIADLTANPKPNYNIDGQDIQWADYLDRLWATLDKVNMQLAAEDGPAELETFGRP